jgi:subtilase-type serine protease
MNKPYALNALATALLLAFASPGQAVTIDLATAPDYASLQYSGASVTTITGIRDRNITGNYAIAGGNTGGLLFDNVLSSSTASPYPVATSNLSNYPGSVASTPYGPSFGSPSGIMRGVGSFKVAGATDDQGYLWDGATATGTTLLPSSLTADPILFTIAHSNFGNQVVGNYDTTLQEGNSFVYNIVTQTYTSVPLNGKSFYPTKQITEVASNTAYGVYNNVIAGGYTGKYGGTTGTYAYIHNQGNDKTYTFSSPDGSIVTHFEGITSAGPTRHLQHGG